MGRGKEEDEGKVAVVGQTVHGTRVSVQARSINSTGSAGSQCHHLAERTPYPAATSLWRLTHVFHQPLCEEKGWVVHPPHPSVPPDPGRIKLFHRLGVGSFPEISRARLSAELFTCDPETFR